MEEKTRMHANTARFGLEYVADAIDQALLGEKRPLDTRQSEQGPFAQALNRVAEIADGAPTRDLEAARADLLFLFSLLRHLQGSFYSSLWDILSRAHVILADVITEDEAKALLGEHAGWLDLDAALGHIHPLKEQEDGTLCAYDSTFLGKPFGTVKYARHEIEARKQTHQHVWQTLQDVRKNEQADKKVVVNE
jgi:hypothetical protein